MEREPNMQFFVLKEEPIADVQKASIDVLKADGSRYGDAPRCETCDQYIGMRLWLPPYRVELETWGHEFADLAITGTDMLVSLRFRQAWERSRLVGLSGFDDVEVVTLKRHRKVIGDPPAYFRAVVSRSRTAIDLAASEFEWDKAPTCPTCRLGDNVKRWKRVIVEQDTWTGEDIFIARGLAGTIIVSERFKEFCERKNVKNAALLPAETYGHDFYPSVS